jgi:outer membrane protein assembly factor BamB
MRVLAPSLVLLGALAGCAGTTPSSAFPRAGDQGDVAAALAQMESVPGVANGSGRPRLFLVTTRTSGSELAAVDLATGNVLWSQRDDLGGRMVVARKAVVYTRPGGVLLARDVAGGGVLWERPLPAGKRRLGYAADGDAVYDVSHAAGNPRQVSIVRYEAQRGSVVWSRELEGEAGAPAARGGVIALPRRSQYVTLLDGGSGRVLADILSREEAASFVRMRPEGLFFGSRGVFLASPDTATGSRRSGGYAQATLPSFVRPQYDRDLYRAEQSDYSAIDRNRILWRMTVDGPRARFTDGLVVAHSFRFFFGLDVGTGRLLWAYSHPREDAVASERTGAHVLYVAADGELGALDARTGRRTWRARIPVDGIVRGATFDAEGFAPPDNAGGAAGALPASLASILWDPDRRFMEVKLYAITELARLQGQEVTAQLLRVLEATDLPLPVVQKATDALVDRRDPASLEMFAAALRARSDYAEDRRPPRLDVLARAAAVTRSRLLLTPLLGHLALPETDPGAVRDIADAALATAAPEAVTPFLEYLLQYRADPAFLRAPTPVIAAAEVLLKLGGAPEKATLLFVAEDPRSLEPLRLYLRRALFEGEAASGARQQTLK